MIISLLLMLVAITIKAQETAFPKLTDPYLGQEPPGMTPEIFLPGINLDGWQPNHLNQNYFNCPFMFLFSEEHKGANDFFLEHSEHKVFDLSIKGTKHPNFNDMAIISGKLGRFSGLTGKIDGRYGLDII